MTKYFLGNNGQEYLTPEDAEKYGEGLKAYRETTTEVKAVTYTEITGQKAPESPVDHVIAPQVPVSNPTPFNPQTAFQASTEPQKVEITPTEPIVPVTPAEVAEIKEEVKKEEIVMQEIPKSVEVVDLNSKTDDELRAMCRARKFMGSARMKRENMIKKLS
jgi:hypothetical protein